MNKHTILFLAANPLGTDRLALDREARAIQVELERSGHRDHFELATRWAAEPLDLLRELRKLKPTVVHFSGRGTGNLAQHGLYFQGSDGRPQLVSAEALAQVFGAAGSSVKLVTLSACHSDAQAAALIAHVDCVVGMLSSISEDVARSFAIGFYGGLGERESVATAYRQGCAAIGLEGLADGDKPRLRVRDGVDAERVVLADLRTRPIELSSAGSGAAESRLEVEAKLDRVAWRLYARPGQSLTALGGQLQDAIKTSRVVLRLKTAKGTDTVPWPSCFDSEAVVESQPSAFVWTGHETELGQELVRLFDNGTIAFDWRSRPPTRLDEVVVVDFDLLALHALAFVRLSAAFYARVAKSAGTSVEAPHTVELALDLPKDHRRIEALFRRTDSFVRPRELMRVAHIKRPRAVVSRLVPGSAAKRRDAVADALVGLLGGLATQFDLEFNEWYSSGATRLYLDETSLRELVPRVLGK